MRDSNRAIFRPSAVQRYGQSSEQPALPHWGAPRVIPFLWALLGLALGSSLMA